MHWFFVCQLTMQSVCTHVWDILWAYLKSMANDGCKGIEQTAANECGNEAFSTCIQTSRQFYVHTNTCIFYGFSQKDSTPKLKCMRFNRIPYCWCNETNRNFKDLKEIKTNSSKWMMLFVTWEDFECEEPKNQKETNSVVCTSVERKCCALDFQQKWNE